MLGFWDIGEKQEQDPILFKLVIPLFHEGGIKRLSLLAGRPSGLPEESA